MNSFYKFFIEVDKSKTNDFLEFLSYHRSVNEFKKRGTGFLVFFIALNHQYYDAFVDGIHDIFGKVKFKKLCCAQCKDESGCLNSAKYGSYCYQHKQNK